MSALSTLSIRRPVAALLPILLLASIVACADEVTSQEPASRRAATGGPQSAASDTPLAVVDGVTITRADLDEFVGDELATLEHQYGSQLFELLEAGVTQAVRQRLLESEASSRGMAVGDLVVEEIESEITVTEADIVAWYAGNQARLQGRPLETLRGPMALRPRHQVLRREQVGRLGLAEIPRISAEAVCEGPKGRTKYVLDRCQRQLRSCRTVCR